MSTELRVLIVEDSEDDALLLLRELKRGGYEPISVTVDTKEATEQALEEQPWDVVISDYKIPGFGGLEALDLVKNNDTHIPFILVSGKVGEELAVEAMKLGADDYVAKDNLPRLAPAIEREIRDSEERKKGQRAQQALKESEEKHRAIYASALDGIVLVDTETGGIADCNPEFAHQAGRDISSLQQMKIWEVVEPKKDSIARQLLASENGESDGAQEIEFIRPDGTVVPIELAGKIVEIGGRKFRQSVTRDITERRVAEKMVAREREFSEAALRQKDRDIRKAYVEILSAVTEEKLVLITPEEIATVLGEPISEKYELSTFDQLADSREFIRKELYKLEFDDEAIGSWVLASGEAIANGVKHATACEVQIHKIGSTVQVRVTDHGSGIDFAHLPKATLLAGFSTKKSLGMGFAVLLDVCDRVLLCTGEDGTTVILEAGEKSGVDELDEILARGLHKVDSDIAS